MWGLDSPGWGRHSGGMSPWGRARIEEGRGAEEKDASKRKYRGRGRGFWRLSSWKRGWEALGRGPGNGWGWRKVRGAGDLLGVGFSGKMEEYWGEGLGGGDPGADGPLPTSCQ